MSEVIIEKEYALRECFGGEWSGSAGASESAIIVSKLIQQISEERNELFLRKEKINQILNELSTTFSNSLAGNVDNYGGKPGDVLSFYEAYEFIQLLPERLLEITPSVLLEPEGCFELDWENNNTGSSFAVSFSGKGEIFFAGLFSNYAKVKGVEFFDHFWIPEPVKTYVLRVIQEK